MVARWDCIISAGGLRGHDHAQSGRLQSNGQILDEPEKVRSRGGAVFVLPALAETESVLSLHSLPSWYQSLPSVAEAFPSTRTMIEVLNTDSSSHCPKTS